MNEKRSAAPPSRIGDPEPRRPRRRPGENRARLLEAGISEFALRGYRGASTMEIAARAEVPQPHVYTNFRTKQELFLECVGAVAERLGERSADPTARTESNSPEAADDELAALILQAVGALGEPALHPELGTALSGLRARLGAPAFDALLVRGAGLLLRRDS